MDTMPNSNPEQRKARNTAQSSSQSRYTRRSVGHQQPDSTSEDIRPVYAAFSNMARMNLYTTLKYIGEKFGISDNAEEGQMFNMRVATFSRLNVEIREKIRAELFEHIPVLQSMVQVCVTKGHQFVTDKDLKNVLQNVLCAICELRNFYTHVSPNNERSAECNLLSNLDKAFDASKRQVKERFSYSEEDYKFIDGDERFSSKEKKYHTDYYFRLRNADSTGLSSAGVAFFICKFLHRKYAYQFLVQSQLFKSSPFKKEENEIMKKVFCAEGIRLPKARLVSILDAPALGLDMLNELQKCPTELFDTLSSSDQKLFNVVEQGEEGSIDEDINLMRRNGDRFPYLAMRYIDEKNVLQGMAFQVALGKYRYKFYDRGSLDGLGENRVRILQKEINGFGPLSEVEERRKTQYDGLIRQWEDVAVDTAQSKPYLTDHQASYAITANRIGLTWNDKEFQPLKNGCFLPELPNPQQKEDGTWSVEKAAIGRNEVPRCWLSTFDLPALVFLKLLGGRPDDVIKNTYANLLKLFTDIAEGNRGAYITGRQPTKQDLEDLLYSDYQLHANQIPEKIADFLMGLSGCDSQNDNKADKEFRAWAEKYIEDTIASLERRLERLKRDEKTIGSKRNRVGKKNFVDIRPGSLARYLAQDILAMQPIDSKREHQGKITSMDFNVMQAALATYECSDAQQMCISTPLGNIFIKAGLVERHSARNNPHPFLHQVLQENIPDTVGFYQKYLREKIKYLKKLGEADYGTAHFLREGHKKHAAKDREYIKALASRYRDTLQLPDGLFADAIQKILNEDPAMPAALKKEGSNTAYLINDYFKGVLQDDSQPFYGYKRHYKVFDTLMNAQNPRNPRNNKKIENIYLTCDRITQMTKKGAADQSEAHRLVDEVANSCRSEEEKTQKRLSLKHQLNRCQENEKHIRRYKTQDMLLLMMAKQLLLDEKITQAGLFKLQNIIPIGCDRRDENNLLNQLVRISAKIQLHDESMKPIMVDGHDMCKTIVQQQIKLKNYGDFYLFIYDTRLGTLLSQLSGEVFQREDLEKELDDYDKRRKEIFRLIHEMERKAASLNPSANQINFSDQISVFKEINDAEKDTICEIRNAFSHNRYPKNLNGILGEQPDLANGVAKKIYKKLYDLSQKNFGIDNISL